MKVKVGENVISRMVTMILEVSEVFCKLCENSRSLIPEKIYSFEVCHIYATFQL